MLWRMDVIGFLTLVCLLLLGWAVRALARALGLTVWQLLGVAGLAWWIGS